MKKLLFFFLFLSFKYWLTAQIAAPNLLCVKRDTLIWDIPTVSCGAINSYRIYAARNINGPYQVLTTILNRSQTRYFHDNTEGGNWYYYMETDANCSGQPRLQSDTLDNQLPSLTAIAALNVIDNRTVEVRWRKNPTPEVTGYIVYKKTNAGLVPIANINNRDTIRYMDTNASPHTQNEEYQVLAVDGCGNTSLFDVNHRTILVKATQSKCNQTITLNWTLYKNWNNPTLRQEVWVSVSGRNPTLYATVGATDTMAVYRNAKDKVRYNFYVRAIESVSNISSKSNEISIVGDITEPVRTLFIKNISVNTKNQVEFNWLWNESARIDSVRVFQRKGDSLYTIIKGFKPIYPLDEQGFYVDTSAKPSLSRQYYYIQTIDECKAKVSSNYASTVHLTGTTGKNSNNVLKWTPFDMQGATVRSYQILRIVDGATTEIGNPIDTSALREYTDVSTLGEKVICYRIGANYTYQLPDGSQENATSYSNTICLSQFTNVWIPNAFTPSGNNPIFRPVFTFTENITDYQMIIFDRWGGIIFKTTNPAEGWEGKRHGSDLPQGTYSYIVRVTQRGSKTQESKGVLMLIR